MKHSIGRAILEPSYRRGPFIGAVPALAFAHPAAIQHFALAPGVLPVAQPPGVATGPGVPPNAPQPGHNYPIWNLWLPLPQAPMGPGHVPALSVTGWGHFIQVTMMTDMELAWFAQMLANGLGRPVGSSPWFGGTGPAAVGPSQVFQPYYPAEHPPPAPPGVGAPLRHIPKLPPARPSAPEMWIFWGLVSHGSGPGGLPVMGEPPAQWDDFAGVTGDKAALDQAARAVATGWGKAVGVSLYHTQKNLNTGPAQVALPAGGVVTHWANQAGPVNPASAL